MNTVTVMSRRRICSCVLREKIDKHNIGDGGKPQD